MRRPFVSHVDTLATTSPAEAKARLTGILFFIAATMCFTGIDTFGKYLMQSLPATQVIWMRFVMHALLMSVVIVAVMGRRTPLRSQRPGLQAVRALFVALSTLFNFLGLRYLQLAEANALFFVAPAFVAILAGPFLGEWAGPRRWAAIAVAFVGVLVIVRPGTGGFNWASLLVLTAALTYALYNISTRAVAGRDDPIVTFALTPFGGVAIFAVPALMAWQAPGDLLSWALLIGLGVFGGVGHGLLLLALRRAPAPILAPFTYIQIVWMTVAGLLVFSDVPEAWTFVGASIVIASGVYLWFRERKQARAVS